jgi:aerobic-type carbon monoxide dehydrogenase small subunit (CoxS/CutS family)
MQIKITINGEFHIADVEPRVLLSDLLRGIGLVSVHQGCDEGVCGACTVLLDGIAVKSCLLLGVQADGSSILTAEGLAADKGLHHLQEAFSECLAAQCGYCTPGLLMTSYDFLKRSSEFDEESVREAISGNICRCTGYANIVEAIIHASKVNKKRNRPRKKETGRD